MEYTLTNDTTFTPPEKKIYWTRKFWDLVVQISNYGVDIVTPDENSVWWFRQVCFITDVAWLFWFMCSSLQDKNDWVISWDCVDEESVPDYITKFTNE
jgi:hypothetical protein